MVKKIQKSVPAKTQKQISGAPAYLEGDDSIWKRSVAEESRRACSVQIVTKCFQNTPKYREEYDSIFRKEQKGE